MELKKILFVCSRNKWRSFTAETIYRNTRGISVKSAGTEDGARIKINSKLILWADTIFVMEKHHKEKLLYKFSQQIAGKEVITLDIPDVYKYMDNELIEELELSVSQYI
ncbi:low molecular weight protein tyrosine phosphatase family protein [Flavobacterium hauense]